MSPWQGYITSQSHVKKQDYYKSPLKPAISAISERYFR